MSYEESKMQLHFIYAITLTLLLCSSSCGPSPYSGEAAPTSSHSSTALRPTEAILNERVEQPPFLRETRLNIEGNIKGAQFISAKDGWLRTERALYKSSDSGVTWEKATINIPLDSYISSSFFISDREGWLIVVSKSETEGHGYGYSSRILFTGDGGKTWVEQMVPQGNVNINDVRFLNSREGVVTGARVVAQQQPHNEIFLARTVDGGMTWTDVSEKIKPQTRDAYGHAFDRGVYVHWTAPSHLLLLTDLGRVLGSADHGDTWSTIVHFEDERRDGSVSSTGYYKIILDAQESASVIGGATGDEGYWGDLIIGDKNNTWASFELTRLPVKDAVFLSAKDILACGTYIPTVEQSTAKRPVGVILRSNDGGRTWALIFRSELSETFISITRFDDDSFYAISDRGTFLRFALKD